MMSLLAPLRPELPLLALAAALLAGPVAATPCFDIGKGEPHQLRGVLHHHVFPGPPNFEDVRKGDRPEPAFVLDLDAPICITGDENADPARQFGSVQVVPGPGVSMLLHQLEGRHVDLTFNQEIAAFSGHHHRPLVAWASAVRPLPR